MIDLVILGATGDLARRKLLPALYQLEAAGRLPDDLRVIGVARRAVAPQVFLEQARESLNRFEGRLDAEVWERFSGRLGYQDSDYSVSSLQTLDLAPTSLIYLALPLEVFPSVAANLGEAGHSKEGGGSRRLIIEKPSNTTSRQRWPCKRRYGSTGTSRRYYALTITWARRPCRTCWFSVLPTPGSSRFGTPSTLLRFRSPWPRRSASRGVGLSTRV